MFILYSSAALVLGCLIDRIVGDPHGLWHPVQGIGWLITRWESFLRKRFPSTPEGERHAGTLMVFLVIACTLIPSGLILLLCSRIHPMLGLLVETLFCGWLIAARSLEKETRRVADALNQSLDEGRRAVSMVVGRDTENLSEEGVVRAAVETVAENTSDGVIAPMFWMAIGGAWFGFFYKAVNTMDSMVGYKNDQYLNFGRSAALFDDVVNFIPARISGLLMVLAARILPGFDGRNAHRIYFRDRFNHASPNSAQTEAVMAGALDVQLAGDAYYFGKLVKKKTIGDPIRSIEREDIFRAHRLMYMTELLALILFTGIKLLIFALVSMAA